MEELTERQKEILHFIVKETESRGFPPTIREIGEQMSIRSTNGVNDHLNALERKGYLHRGEQQSRSLVVTKLRVAFGRKKGGLDFKAIDEKPVHFFFLIVAPPLEVSNQYLPVLGKIAQFSKESDVPARLLQLTEPKQFLALLEEKGV